MFDPNDCYEPCAERAAADVIDGEAIIINLETGVYYSMQGIGGRIWSMLTDRRPAGSMIDEIVLSYDVTVEQAANDLAVILQQLLGEGLIQPCSVPSNVAAVATPRQAYAQPRLEIYRDMQDLLALDPPAPGMSQISWSNGAKR
jgi:hypothetical protein